MTQIQLRGQNINSKTVLEIGKFSILWNMFEKNKCNNNCTFGILESLVANTLTSTAWQNFAAVLRGRASYLDCSITPYVEHHLALGRGLNVDQKSKIKNFITSDGKECIVGGFIAIFRLRNNMFHGLKNVSDLNNQIELFKAMNAVLEGVV